MNFLIDTLKGASLHVHAVWLALAYIAVIIAMAVDFVAGLRKAKQAGIASTSRGYKMTTEKAAKYFLPMLCLTCVDLMTSVILPAPFFTMLMAGFNIFCEWKSVLESTHDKQELRVWIDSQTEDEMKRGIREAKDIKGRAPKRFTDSETGGIRKSNDSFVSYVGSSVDQLLDIITGNNLG